MTRDELLATVHVLEPGDLLVVRIGRTDLPTEQAAKIEQLVRAKVPAGVGVLVASYDIAFEQYRKVGDES